MARALARCAPLRRAPAARAAIGARAPRRGETERRRSA
jgi:GntR family transcriptional regulator/MocR family aminotransferase